MPSGRLVLALGRPELETWIRNAHLEGDEMPTEIDRHEVQQLLQRGAQLVEVLPPDEYEEDHLPGAINLPLRRLETEAVRILDRARPVIVYCWDTA
jgi:rhodanese-related sulfurtransferase